ncbi:hypothetical protein LTR53_006886 [Teratosphaeriaceae sp. CCFEE 6253]|nr:hypothetical protein LTR53_006886 [Teratosphaeriaceae sp. CCFEE 6253]
MAPQDRARKGRAFIFMPSKSNRRLEPTSSRNAPAEKRKVAMTPTQPWPKLRISIDYGTSTLSASMVVVYEDTEPLPADTQLVHFGPAHQSPQRAAWDAHNDFIWGHGVEAAIDDGRLQRGEDIRLWKLLLDPGYDSSPLAARVKQQLGTHSVDELIKVHIAAVVEECTAWAKSATFTAGMSNEVFDAMPIQLFVSVPQMWTPPANRRMAIAAKSDKIETVTLLWEPHNAAAYFAERIRYHPRGLAEQDCVLVVDAGAGTADLCTLQIMSSIGNGSKVQLETVGKPEGALHGSQSVNEEFVQFMCEKANQKHGVLGNGFQHQCENILSITVADAISQINDGFDVVKAKFSTSRDTHLKHAVVLGNTGEHWFEVYTSADLVDFFKPAVEGIFECIRRQLASAPNIKAIILPGGFGKSKYLIAQLRGRYRQLKVFPNESDEVGEGVAYPTTARMPDQPVSRGGLYRNRIIQDRTLSLLDSFAIGEVQQYNPEVHHDANLPRGPPGPSTKANEQLVEHDPFRHNTSVVYDRLVYLVNQGIGVGEHWQTTFIYEGETFLEQQIYWLRTPLPASSRMLANGRAAKDEDARLRPELHPWGPPHRFKLPNLKKLGFDMKSRWNGDEAYEIFYLIKMEIDGANISASFSIAMLRSRYYNDQGRFDPQVQQYTKADVYTVVDASCTHVVRDEWD